MPVKSPTFMNRSSIQDRSYQLDKALERKRLKSQGPKKGLNLDVAVLRVKREFCITGVLHQA